MPSYVRTQETYLTGGNFAAEDGGCGQVASDQTRTNIQEHRVLQSVFTKVEEEK